VITRLTPGVLLPPDHRHEFKILIPITLLDIFPNKRAVYLKGKISLAHARCTHLSQVIKSQNNLFFTRSDLFTPIDTKEWYLLQLSVVSYNFISNKNMKYTSVKQSVIYPMTNRTHPYYNWTSI
jgi:phosphorylcholine metabolism protein LicD